MLLSCSGRLHAKLSLPPATIPNTTHHPRTTIHRLTISHPPTTIAPLPTTTPGVYRSAFPTKKNLPFLKKLKLRAVLALVPEAIPEWLTAFYAANDIELLQRGLPGNKEPFVDIPEDMIADALQLLLDNRNYPVLIHCNKGKHRTGCVVGCLRKLQRWSHVAICDECVSSPLLVVS
jgi:tyrosine-protein phosphatase SIW14